MNLTDKEPFYSVENPIFRNYITETIDDPHLTILLDSPWNMPLALALLPV
jgi:hypothetical protein